MNGIDGVVYVCGDGQYLTTQFKEFVLIGIVLGCETRFTKKYLFLIGSFVLNSQFFICLSHPVFLGTAERCWILKRIR